MSIQITGGKFRNTKLAVPSNNPLRPTLSRIREDIFNIIRPDIQEANFLDLYAGCGAVGLEALSQGARQVTFVEKDPKCASVIKKNVDRLKASPYSKIITTNAENAISTFFSDHTKFDIIFLDPPFGKNIESGILKLLQDKPIFESESKIIVQTDQNTKLDEKYGNIQLNRTKSYKMNQIWFFKVSI